MSSVQSDTAYGVELADILSAVRTPGNFFATGTMEFHLPELRVEGVGPLALPILVSQAEQLIGAAERAPFGRGQETLVDTTVRRTWQIAAEHIHIGGRHWPDTLARIVAVVAEGLGVTEPVVPELYKMLIYDTGSFFVEHRDTEKCPGMFATLSITLPSAHCGGELVVRHRDREALLDARAAEPGELAFAAFYADCNHEILPVTEGHRVTLIYNLLRKAGGGPTRPPSYDSEQNRLAALLSRWSAHAEDDDDRPAKLIFPLEHAYTQAELSFAGLKGADAAAGAVTAAAAVQAGCDLHLALLTIEESGSAEHDGYQRSRRRHWRDDDDDDDDDAFVISEVCERSATLADWRCLDGQNAPLGVFPFEDEEVCPPSAFEDLDADEQHFHEATGNEGASFERTYRRAALVLWPRSRRLSVIARGGLAVSLPYLSGLTDSWVAAVNEDVKSASWSQADALIGEMLRWWTPIRRHPASRETESGVGSILRLATRLGAPRHIETLLADVIAAGEFGTCDIASVMQAVLRLNPERARGLLERVVTANVQRDFAACAGLFERASALGRFDLTGAAVCLVDALPGAQGDYGRPIAPAAIADLMAGLDRIDQRQSDLAVDALLQNPRAFGPDAVLVPVILDLRQRVAGGGAFERLRVAGLDHLRRRIAEPLAPPSDWARDSRCSCSCQHCRGLSRFLADPTQPHWIFKAPQSERSHVEATIRDSRCDIDCATVRRGSPHELHCTKNQASHEHRVEQRRRDEANCAAMVA